MVYKVLYISSQPYYNSLEESKNNDAYYAVPEDYDISMFTSLTADEFTKKFKNGDEMFVLSARGSCGFCQQFRYTAAESIEKYNYTLYYLDSAQVTDEQFSAIMALDEKLSETYGSTPNVYYIKGKKVVDVSEAVVEENMNEEVEVIEKPIKKVNKEPLNDDDEIGIISLIPNVSYKDSRTNDFYKWDDVDDIEYMTFGTIKNLWRNNKDYFRKLWLKPLDDRVINKLGLEGTYSKYEFLMDKENYTRENINKLCDAISSTPNGMKHSVCDKIKILVMNGDISDIKVIKAIDGKLGLDLISLLD